MRYGFVMMVLAWGSVALADRIELRDGTVIEGTAIRQGDRYWVREGEGPARFIPADQVVAVRPSAAAAPASSASVPAGSASINSMRLQANASESPLGAVAMWLKFLSSRPAAADVPAAQAELEMWLDRTRRDFEKVAGKWLDPEQRAAAVHRASAANAEARKLSQAGKPLQAIRKIEEAIAAYPSSYPLMFHLAFTCINAKRYDQAIESFERCRQMRPWAVEPVNNLAVFYWMRQHQDEAALMFYRAAQLNPLEGVAKNLMAAVAQLPPEVRNSGRLKPAVTLAAELTGRYKLQPATRWAEYHWVFLVHPPEPLEGSDARYRGLAAAGSGTVVSADGAVLTSSHLVEKAPNVLVLLEDGTVKLATVAAVDARAGLALLRIKDSPRLAAVEAGAEPRAGEVFVAAAMRNGPLSASVQVGAAELRADAGRLAAKRRMPPVANGGAILDAQGAMVGLLSGAAPCAGPDVEELPGVGLPAILAFLAQSKLDLRPAQNREALSAPGLADKLKSSLVCVIVPR